MYQKVNSNLETAFQFGYTKYTTAGSNTTQFGFGCKYQLDDDSAVRAKINNASQLGLSYQQKLRQGIVIHKTWSFSLFTCFLQLLYFQVLPLPYLHWLI